MGMAVAIDMCVSVRGVRWCGCGWDSKSMNMTSKGPWCNVLVWCVDVGAYVVCVDVGPVVRACGWVGMFECACGCECGWCVNVTMNAAVNGGGAGGCEFVHMQYIQFNKSISVLINRKRGKKKKEEHLVNKIVKNPNLLNFPQGGVAGQAGHKPAQPCIANPLGIETAM